MKTLITTVCISLVLNVSFGQKKLYGSDGKQKTKGTVISLQKIESGTVEKGLISGPVVAALGTALLNSGVGIVKVSKEKQVERATAAYETNAITLHKTGITDIRAISYFFEREENASPKPFQTINLSVEHALDLIESGPMASKGDLKTESGTTYNRLTVKLESISNELTRAIAKKKKNLLLYEITVSVSARKLDKKAGKVETIPATVKFFCSMPNAFQLFENTEAQTILLPEDLIDIQLSLSIKEVNPFYLTNNGIAAYLEGYGESNVAALSVLLFGKQD